jgi:CRP/FNR family transcriptional regulator
MSKQQLGKTYEDGQVIVQQGDIGDSMYVIQEGRVQIIHEHEGIEQLIREAGEGELIGEMAIYDREVRSATVRAKGTVRVLTIDKRNFLRRIAEEPSIALRIVQTMSRRVRELSGEVSRLKSRLDERIE